MKSMRVVLSALLSGTILAVFVACGPVTHYDGVFDPDAVEIDEELLLEIDEDIIEEQ